MIFKGIIISINVIPPWLSFLIVILIILIFSKYELSIVLTIASFLFAILTQIDILESLFCVFSNPSIIMLAIAVAIIPIIGGVMEESGLMLELVQKMNVSKKTSLMIVPAFFGLLPVAGGALMSAPILDQIDQELNPNQKVAINVWFRHVLILIYPISSAMIVASVLTGISMYLIIIALIPSFILMIVIGYLMLIKGVKTQEEPSKRDLKRVMRNLTPIIIVPIIDFIGRTFFNFSFSEIFLLVGLLISLLVALKLANMQAHSLKEITKKMRIWRFSLLIFAMFWFLDIFEKSGVPEEIGSLNLSFFYFICIGFFLGFATGRIQIPISILIPIYLIQLAINVMPLIDFVFVYFSVFLGYLITPIHPCVSYSINYFETDYKSIVKHLVIPALLCFGLLLIVYFVISLF